MKKINKCETAFDLHCGLSRSQMNLGEPDERGISFCSEATAMVC